MKYTAAAALILVLAVIFTACRMQFTEQTTTEAPQGTSVIEHIEDEITTAETSTEEQVLTTQQQSGTDETTTAEANTQPQQTVQPTTAKSSGTTQTAVATESQTIPPELTSEVDLSITLPEKNGTMYVDKKSTNKYIAAVVSQRKLDAAYLVAVYSVPESGQNYVFEFTSEDFTTDTLRRVYLLNSSCKITGVAATNSSEREKLSSTENWFCMNVLIKGVIFPEIEDRF